MSEFTKDVLKVLRTVIYSILIAVMIGLLTGVHTEIGIAVLYVLTYWILTYLEYMADKREQAKEVKKKAMFDEYMRLEEESSRLDGILFKNGVYGKKTGVAKEEENKQC